MNKSHTIFHQPTVELIEPDRWIPFLAQFTRENRGAHAVLRIIGSDPETAYRVETENRPFDGVSADVKDNERRVWISFSFGRDDHIDHSIASARTLRMLFPGGEAGPMLEVESADGSKAILELNTPDQYSLGTA